MSSNPTVIIVLVVVVVIVLIAVSAAVQARKNDERQQAFRALAQSQGWQFVAEDDSYAKRFEGPPFRVLGGGRVRNIVTGDHQKHPFCAFEYRYTTTQHNGQTTTTTTHHFGVWVINLPVAVPAFSVGEEGLFGGRVAEAFGFERVASGDEEFDAAFKVKCDDNAFAGRLLTPELVARLKRTGPWDWRLSGTSMISFTRGQLEPDAVLPRLDLMIGVLDAVPAEVWNR